ncbi:MAG TPA: putative glycoside hydrolase [Fimbriimonadaceae bacterium]|nr:putative glycoside hydrolase [Fimbriimonadaceae bacterium]
MKIRAGVALVFLAAVSCQQETVRTTQPPVALGHVVIKAAPKAPEPRYPRPEHVRGLYMTAWVAGATARRDEILHLIKDSELNSVVIDVRDNGENYWETGIPLSKEAHATRLAVPKPKELMQLLDDEDIYPIARIACFADSFVPRYDPSRAVQKPDGKPWKERSGRTWLDPYNKKNWEYIGQIVDFAVKTGFPEIQLDYVRFPSGGKKSSMVFPAQKDWPEGTTEAEVIEQFAEFIHKRLPKSEVLSADIFGIVSSNTTKDQGIGQDIDHFPKPFDLLCPMVYPNHYAKGEYGIKVPADDPYLIVHKSVKDYVDELGKKPLRPWLQTFGGYDLDQVRDQIKAIKELGVNEYLLWHASNKYEGLLPKDTSDLDAKPAVTVEPQPPALSMAAD